MTLEQFAAACGAEPKWVENSARALGLDLVPDRSCAERLGLVHQLQRDLGVPLAVARAMADAALSQSGNAEGVVQVTSGIGMVMVDTRRYRSDFAARLAMAQAHLGPRRMGRPARTRSTALARARAYGLDVGLLKSSVARSPSERLRMLNENMEFVRALGTRST